MNKSYLNLINIYTVSRVPKLYYVDNVYACREYTIEIRIWYFQKENYGKKLKKKKIPFLSGKVVKKYLQLKTFTQEKNSE